MYFRSCSRYDCAFAAVFICENLCMCVPMCQNECHSINNISEMFEFVSDITLILSLTSFATFSLLLAPH